MKYHKTEVSISMTVYLDSSQSLVTTTLFCKLKFLKEYKVTLNTKEYKSDIHMDAFILLRKEKVV